MKTETGTMLTEVVFNDTKTERYILRKVWDESKPIVSLIMTNPSSANAVTIDMTVHYAICNLFKLNYGGMEILNMTSTITTKIDTKKDITLSDENAEYILQSAQKSDKVILAWGRIGENNKKVRAVQMKLLDILKPFDDKLFTIASETGEFGFHPLAPQIRFIWHIIPFVCPDYLAVKKEGASDESPQGEQEQTSDSTPVEAPPDESGIQPTGEVGKPTKDRKHKKDAQTA